MKLRKLFAALGPGGASLETELSVARTRPGGAVDGQVLIIGGDVEQEIEHVAVAFQAVVEVEGPEDTQFNTPVSFGGQIIGGPFSLAAGSRQRLRFSLPVPWEMPFNLIGGQEARKVKLGLSTELAIDRALDKSDLDRIQIEPLPGQQLVLDTLVGMGARFTGSDIEHGTRRGGALPFYQEVEFSPPSEIRGAVNQLEVVFLAGPQEMTVILEADRKGGLLIEGRDETAGFRMPSVHVDGFDVGSALEALLARLGRRRGMLG